MNGYTIILVSMGVIATLLLSAIIYLWISNRISKRIRDRAACSITENNRKVIK